MPHPDEGLIHAWLDGALPPDEATRIEALVRDDRAWGAAAAEARGLIANASRVLASLDDAPSALSQSVPPMRSASAPAARRWGWRVSSIAAVLLVAVVARVTWRERTPDDVAPLQRAPVATSGPARTTAKMPAPPRDVGNIAAAPSAPPVPAEPRGVAAEVAITAAPPPPPPPAPAPSRAMAAKSAAASSTLDAAATTDIAAERRAGREVDRTLITRADVTCLSTTVHWDNDREPEVTIVVPWRPDLRAPDLRLRTTDAEGRTIQIVIPAGAANDRVVRLSARGDTLATGRVAELTRCRP
jgi:hypothetical protein